MWRGSANIDLDESELLSGLAERCPVISLEPEAAREGAIINYRLRQQGSQIGSRDCLIAGIVVAGNDILITRNVKHFSRIKGIKLETY
jgi:tRNA(fMet)-specific endonuclease VapC